MEAIVPNLEAVINNPSLLGGRTSRDYEKEKASYIERYNKYITKHSVIAFDVYVDRRDDVHLAYYYFQIHSDGDNDIIYDVVLQFNPPKGLQVGTQVKNTSVENFTLKFFTNSPGFLFRYAYVFAHKKLIPSILLNKFSDVTLKNPPEKSNPHLTIGFDSTLFYAMYYLNTHKNLMDISQLDTNTVHSLREFPKDNIPTPDDVNHKRNPQNLVNIKKIETKLKKAIEKNPVTQLIGSAQNAIKAIRPKSALHAVKTVKPQKATKAVTASSPRRKRR